MSVFNNSTILQELTQAKIAHGRWVRRADHLVSGLPVDKEFIPLEATTCGFGKWFYTSGTQLRQHKDYASLMEQIEVYHDDLHTYYGEIYKLYFVMPEKRSILHKVMTFNSKKISKKEEELAKVYYQKLEYISGKLVELLTELESAIKKYK